MVNVRAGVARLPLDLASLWSFENSILLYTRCHALRCWPGGHERTVLVPRGTATVMTGEAIRSSLSPRSAPWAGGSSRRHHHSPVRGVRTLPSTLSGQNRWSGQNGGGGPVRQRSGDALAGEFRGGESGGLETVLRPFDVSDCCAILGVALSSMSRVLVVDGDVRIRADLTRVFGAAGLEVVTAADGPRALRAAVTGAFDVMVLDVVLPGLSGIRVLERVRAYGVDTLVLLTSAQDGEIQRAKGLDLGADGYIVKPFSCSVLVARVRELLCRSEVGADRTRKVLRLGGLTVDPADRSAEQAGRSVELTPREFEVLYALLSRCGTVLSRDELLRLVWSRTYATTPNVVEVYIGYVRRKLRAVGAEQLLRTVRGRGYEMPIPSEIG